MDPSKRLFWQVLLATGALHILSFVAFWQLGKSLLLPFVLNSVAAYILYQGDRKMQALAPPGFVQFEIVPIGLPMIGAVNTLMAFLPGNFLPFILMIPFTGVGYALQLQARPMRRKSLK